MKKTYKIIHNQLSLWLFFTEMLWQKNFSEQIKTHTTKLHAPIVLGEGGWWVSDNGTMFQFIDSLWTCQKMGRKCNMHAVFIKNKSNSYFQQSKQKIQFNFISSDGSCNIYQIPSPSIIHILYLSWRYHLWHQVTKKSLFCTCISCVLHT